MGPVTLSSITMVIYHDPCPDGLSAAKIIWEAQQQLGVPLAQYIPRSHSPEHAAATDLNFKNQHVLVLDYTFPRVVMDRLWQDTSGHVMVLDHHETATDRLAAFPPDAKEVCMDHSGVALAWRWVHGQQPAPRLVQLIEDYDLFNFCWPDECEILRLGMSHLPFTLDAWPSMTASAELWLAQGRPVWAAHCAVLRAAMKRARPGTLKDFPHYRCLVLEADHDRAQLARLMYSTPDVDIAVVYSYPVAGENTIKASLFARKGGPINVAKICSAYPGGGGHAGAAGVTLANIKTLLQ